MSITCLYGHGICESDLGAGMGEMGKHCECSSVCPINKCAGHGEAQLAVDAASAERYFGRESKGMLDQIVSDTVRKEIQARRTDTLPVSRGVPRVAPQCSELATYDYEEKNRDDSGISPVNSEGGFPINSPAGRVPLQTHIEDHPISPNYRNPDDIGRYGIYPAQSSTYPWFDKQDVLGHTLYEPKEVLDATFFLGIEKQIDDEIDRYPASEGQKQAVKNGVKAEIAAAMKGV